MTFVIKINFGRLGFMAVIISTLISCSSSRRTTRVDENADSKLQKKYAALIHVPESQITNKQLYTFIDKWIGTKYKYGAQQNNGIDCSGFTQLLAEAVYGKKIPRTSQAQYDQSKRIKARKNLEEGDLVFFTTVPGKKISHVGIYLQNDRFINATNSGVLISDMNLKYWDDRFVAGGKF